MTLDAALVPLAGRRQATIALMIATAMQAFDATIANVALPQLERGFGGGIGLGAWVMTSYLCASAVTAILTGWLRRRWGARRIFTAAVTLFLFASLLCAVANTFSALILFRLVQGAAAGVIQPLSQAILLDLYPKPAHGRMLAIWGATIMAGPMLGPVLGGFITDLSSWRWIFAVNAPIAAVALCGLPGLPSGTERADAGPIDVVGIVLLTMTTGSLQLLLERSVGRLWPPSAELLFELAAALIAGIVIAVRARRARFRLFRFAVFRDVNFALASSYNFLVGAMLFTTIVFVPALGEGPFAWTATQAGLVIAPRGIGTMVTMLAVRSLIDRVDHRLLLVVGLVITAAALGMMAAAPSAVEARWLAILSAAQGVGVGLLFTPLSTLAFSTTSGILRTDAAGVYNLARQLGCASGVAAMTAFLQLRTQTHLLGLYRHGEVLASAHLLGLYRHGEVLASAHLHNAAALAAFADCFRLLAMLMLAMAPGVLLFRIARAARAQPTTG
jgi:MFS transporter, DHA2 family, multidrug resistance protein